MKPVGRPLDFTTSDEILAPIGAGLYLLILAGRIDVDNPLVNAIFLAILVWLVRR